MVNTCHVLLAFYHMGHSKSLGRLDGSRLDVAFSKYDYIEHCEISLQYELHIVVSYII